MTFRDVIMFIIGSFVTAVASSIALYYKDKNIKMEGKCMNRQELSQIIMGTVKYNSSKEEMLKHLHTAIEKLKLVMDKDISHGILDKKAKLNRFNIEFNDDLSSTIDSLEAGDFYEALTHLSDIFIRHYKYNDDVTPYELYICRSIIQSIIKAVDKDVSHVEIKVVDIESIFYKTYDIDKFIDEYREFIVWLDDKYPSFREKIKKDDWIQRIIKQHDEILMDLRNIIKSEVFEPRHWPNRREIISRIYDESSAEKIDL